MVLHRSTLVVMFAAVVLTCGALAAQNNQDAGMVRVLAAEAMVRVTADPNSLTLARVPGGTVLEMRSKEGAWYSVWLPGETPGLRRLGYVAASDVERMGGEGTTRATQPEPVSNARPAAAPSPATSSFPVRTVKGGLDDAKLYTDRLPSSSHVVMKLFSATDADLTNGEKKEETKTLQADGPRMLAERFVTKLRELGPFADVSSAPGGALPADALVVEGKFVELDPGSRAKRYVVGFGAGKSAVAVEGSIKSADGTILATFRQRRVGVMGIGGGDSLGKLTSDAKSIGEDLAKFVSAWAKGNLK